MAVLSLILTPADVSLFREPRPFDETGGNAFSLLPSPQTTAGAIRTWLLRGSGVSLAGLGKDVKRHNGSVLAALNERCPSGHSGHWVLGAALRGPLLCLTPGSTLLLPIPFHLGWAERQGRVRRLFPLSQPFPGVAPPEHAPAEFRPAGRPMAEELTPLEGYLPEAVFGQSALKASDPLPSDFWEKVRTAESLYGLEPRVGLGVDSRRNAAIPGRLYGISFLRLKEFMGDPKRRVAFRVDIEVDIETEADVRASIETICAKRPWLWLGGESRPAHVEIAATPPSLPRQTSFKVPECFCTYLLTPGLFENGRWYPHRLIETCDLISAIVGTPTLHASWDVARGGPQPARLAVSAGAVHFWKIRDVAKPPDDPHGTCLSDSSDDCQAGWGLCLRGEWDYV